MKPRSERRHFSRHRRPKQQWRLECHGTNSSFQPASFSPLSPEASQGRQLAMRSATLSSTNLFWQSRVHSWLFLSARHPPLHHLCLHPRSRPGSWTIGSARHRLAQCRDHRDRRRFGRIRAEPQHPQPAASSLDRLSFGSHRERRDGSADGRLPRSFTIERGSVDQSVPCAPAAIPREQPHPLPRRCDRNETQANVV